MHIWRFLPLLSPHFIRLRLGDVSDEVQIKDFFGILNLKRVLKELKIYMRNWS